MLRVPARSGGRYRWHRDGVDLNDLLYLVAGAGLALGGQLVLQLRVVPRAERRKRREDRWERDLLALGELLTAELPDRAMEARSTQLLLQVFAQLAWEGDDAEDRRADANRRQSEAAAEAVERYRSAAETRVVWLVNRIVGIAPDSSELRRFRLLHTEFRLVNAAVCHYTHVRSDFIEGEYDKQWNEEWELRQDLIEFVEVLIRKSPPRDLGRMRHYWRALVTWGRNTVRSTGASPTT